MIGIGYKFLGTVVALIVLAVTVICPCAIGIFGGSGQGRPVMSCCEHHEDGGKPAKDSGEDACKAFCSTRAFDVSKSVKVDVSPSQLVGIVMMPVAITGLAVAPAHQVAGDFQLPHSLATSLLRLHCALLV
jgi:hypothetical protein